MISVPDLPSSRAICADVKHAILDDRIYFPNSEIDKLSDDDLLVLQVSGLNTDHIDIITMIRLMQVFE